MSLTVSLLPTPPRVNRTIGSILQDAGVLSLDDIERVLRLQQQEGLLFGESALRLGVLEPADLEFALARQFAHPYLRESGEGPPLSSELVAAYRPFGSELEPLRLLRTQLMLRWFDAARSSRVLTLVGAARYEGRSVVAGNLAILMSQLGLKTLLIDADLRHPRQHQLFGLGQRSGLSTWLAGRSGKEAIERIEGLSNVSVLPAGPRPPNPLELLSRSVLRDLFEEAQSEFDVVLVDTSGFGEGEDPLLVARSAGAALLLARPHSSRTAALSTLVDGMHRSGVQLVGAVLNPFKGRGVSR